MGVTRVGCANFQHHDDYAHLNPTHPFGRLRVTQETGATSTPRQKAT